MKYSAALFLPEIVNVFFELHVFCLTRDLEVVTGQELVCVHSVAVSIILLALLQVNPFQLHVSPRQLADADVGPEELLLLLLLRF